MALAAVLVAADTVAAPLLRIGSGPLNASVGNERDAALDRAVSWLVDAQSAEGCWGASNIVATAVAALGIRGDREIMTPSEAAAVDKAVAWLLSPACTNELAACAATNDLAAWTAVQRARAWRHLALTVLRPAPHPASDVVAGVARCMPNVRSDAFDVLASAELAESLARLLEGPFTGTPSLPGKDPAGIFIAATFSAIPPARTLQSLVEKLACVWNEGMPAVWTSDPEAGWWLARAINRATGGNLSLPADETGQVRDVNWRGILAGKWINSQRVDSSGNGHWGGDAEKTAFAILLLGEL